MNPDLARWRAQLSPQQPALHAGGRWWNYAELDARADRLATALRSKGLGHGDRVAILAQNHLAHFDLMLAAPRCGCIPVPFNHRLSLGEQKALAADIAPSLWLHDSAHAQVVKALPGPAIALGSDYEEWLQSSPPAARAEAVVSAEDTALILFTGGSTGRPKGAQISYRQQFYNAINTLCGWGLSAEDSVIQATPCFHAAVNALATPLLHAGGRVVLMPQFDPCSYLQAVREHRISLLFLVPTMYQMLSEAKAFPQADFGSVRWAISGGAPCPAPVREAFVARGVRFRQGYGMTEAGVNCFAISLDEAAAYPESVGRPMPHTQAVIRSAEGLPVEDGEAGELTLAGPHLFSGYYGRASETAATLKEGWLWTGDLATRDSAGRFRICGRRKEMFISGGENVYPAEVEAALLAQAEVAEAAVVGIPDARWGESGLAFVVSRPGHSLDPAALRSRLKSTLAGYKLPRQIVLCDSLPKTGAGKIDKPALRARHAQQENAA